MSDPTSPPVSAPSSGWRTFGLIVMGLGIALTVGAGLCTTAMFVGDMTSGGGGGDIDLSGIEFFVGGPFILVGALMWWGGNRMRKPKAKAGSPPSNTPPPVS